MAASGKPSLMDVLGATAPGTIEIRGASFPVHGVSISEMGRIARSSPAIYAILMSGGAATREEFVGRLIVGAPECVAPLIAAGIGKSGDAETEAAANMMLPEEQLKALTKIAEVSLPNGIRPIVEQAKALGKTVGLNPKSLGLPATNSPQE